ncbi:MAG: hypothetical protein JXB42_00725 [Deltaproteobacteria bacterium]|nr:hypothetical protein [Deltaproteobacteria bacterium]
MFLFSAFLFSVPAVFGEDFSVEELEAEAAGVIINEDIAGARTNAIADSLRKAVEGAVGGLVDSEVLARHFETVNSAIFSKPRNYIQNYRIVKESVDGILYTVQIKASVSVGSIKRDLKNLGLLTIEEGQQVAAATEIISVVVTGIESYSDFVRLRETLKGELEGVKNLYQRRMERGTAALDIEITGGVPALIERLTVKKFRYFSLDVARIAENRITVQIVK